MKYNRIIVISVTALLICMALFPAYGQDSPEKRPKIGLVLSGGGAKGLAHIGVIKVLEEEGIKVDYITGTSMGSIVGGMYAIGYNAEQLEQIAHEMKWDRLLSDAVPRRDLPIYEKDDDGKYIIAFALKKWGIELPKGLIRGQKLTTLLARLSMHVHHINDFDDLPIPFRCIGADIETGKAVVMKSGYFPDALRASMAIPSVFTPIEFNDYLLIDGGVIRNFPVSDAIDMGADIIIGVDVQAPALKKDEIDSLLEVMEQTALFMGEMSTKQEKYILKHDNENNIYIHPDITGYTSSSFGDRETVELIKRGEEAARKILPQIRALAEEQKQYDREEDKTDITPFNPEDKIFITGIEINGLKRVSKRMVLGELNIYTHRKHRIKWIEERIDRLYATRFFDRILYRFEPVDEGYRLIITVTERKTTFLKAGFNYDTDQGAAILLNTTFRNVMGKGSKLSFDARLSENPGVKLDYFIQTGWRRPALGFQTIVQYDRLDVNSYDEGDLASRYKFQDVAWDVQFVANVYNLFALGMGAEKAYVEVNSIISTQEEPKKRKIEALNYFGFIRLDTLDRTFYPRSGFQLHLDGKYLTDDLNIGKIKKFENFQKYTVRIAGYIPVHRVFTIFLGIEGGAIFAHEPYYWVYEPKRALAAGNISDGFVNYQRKIPFVYLNYMGGLSSYRQENFTFTGLNFMQANSQNIAIARLNFQIEMVKDLFLIMRGNVGKLNNNFSHLFNLKDLIYGYGVTIGYNSLIGPIELTVMSESEENKVLAHVNVGYRF